MRGMAVIITPHCSLGQLENKQFYLGTLKLNLMLNHNNFITLSDIIMLVCFSYMAF